MSEGPSREWIEKWAELNKPVHSGTANELTYKARAMTVVQHMLIDFDAEQAAETEAERLLASMKERLRHDGTCGLTGSMESSILAWMRENRNLALQTVGPSEQAPLLKCDRCGDVLGGLCPECDRTVEAQCAEPQPASEKRKVRARTNSMGKPASFYWVIADHSGPLCNTKNACREHLESIMAAAGAEVVWEEGNE